MMKQFKEKYREEAKGTINQIVKILPLISQNQQAKKLRYDIFRHMHSMKGGGAMFGFEELSKLSAVFEKAYDRYRENDDKIPQELFNITTRVIPLLRALLTGDGTISDENIEIKNQIIKELEIIK